MPGQITTILVVDDNPATLYSTSHILRKAGFRVLEAVTGTAAIQLAQGDVDLVILDVQLPDMNGFEVCRQIRLFDKSTHVPVIHLSASFVNDVDKVQGLELGADGYLTHPVEPPVLIATVRAFLRIRQSEIDRENLLASERAARAEAERANRFKDDFLATLSHELRTPLQSMLGWAQLLKLGDVDPNTMAQAVDSIESAAQMQSQMIADLLDVSRITSGKIQLDLQMVDLASIVDSVLNSALPAAEAKDIELSKSYTGTGGPVTGDPSRLQQIVWNLVNNAIKFTPKRGRIQVGLERASSCVELSVTDNGQGIDSELLPRIFERFLQGDASSTRYHGGLGLGLSIARQLTEMHGGTIRAESAGAGAGSKFVVSLPISAAPPVRSPGSAPAYRSTAVLPSLRLSRLDNVRVMLVDDDPGARTVLARIVSSTGATTNESDGVMSALSKIADYQPHILVSDLGMPGHDGFELIRSVRRMGYSSQSLPAIALTAFARPDDRQRALLAGYQVHLAKPVEPSELIATIATLVGRTGTAN